MRIFTNQAIWAPIARPYRVQTDWGIISEKLENTMLVKINEGK